MVPPRSRKPAGRRRTSSRGHRRDGLQESCAHAFGRDPLHAAMIRGTAPQEAWAAIGLLLNDVRARGHGCRPKGIGRTKCRDYRQTNCGRNVHRSRIITQKCRAARQQRRQFRNFRSSRKVERRSVKSRLNRRRHSRFTRRSEQDHLGIALFP